MSGLRVTSTESDSVVAAWNSSWGFFDTPVNLTTTEPSFGETERTSARPPETPGISETVESRCLPSMWKTLLSVKSCFEPSGGVERALPGLNNFFCFLLALLFSLHAVHPATVTFTFRLEFVSDYRAYQVIGRYRRARRGGLTKLCSDWQKGNQTSKGASSEKRQ